MFEKKIKILINEGLHIRPAVKIVKLSKNFESEINIYNNNISANAKNLFQLQKLGIKYKDIITISANGNDELIAVNEIIKLINSLINV